MVAAAAEAAPRLAAAPAGRRAALLAGVADALDADVDRLVATAGAETALNDARLRGEVARTSGRLRFLGAVVADGGYLEAMVDHAGGRALADLAAGRPDPIPFYGELGSLDPVVVTAAAAREGQKAVIGPS